MEARQPDGVILTPLPALREQASDEILLLLITDISPWGLRFFPVAIFIFMLFKRTAQTPQSSLAPVAGVSERPFSSVSFLKLTNGE